MEGPALHLTLAPVTWDGLDCCVKLVRKERHSKGLGIHTLGCVVYAEINVHCEQFGLDILCDTIVIVMFGAKTNLEFSTI